jgi:hypothetical protein
LAQHQADDVGAGCTERGPDAEFLAVLGYEVCDHSIDTDRNAVDVDEVDPNRAGRECWPSTQMVRRRFTLRGFDCGSSAFEILPRLPDPAIG